MTLGHTSIVDRRYERLCLGGNGVIDVASACDATAREVLVADQPVLDRAALMVAFIEMLIGATHSPDWEALVESARSRVPGLPILLDDEHLVGKLVGLLQETPDE